MSDANAPLWTSQEIMAVTNGTASTVFDVTGISIDSRNIKEGDLFIALKGPNFDGHKFVAMALENGAVGALVSTQPKDCDDSAPLITVEDTFTALQDLGHGARIRSKARMIGLTGSTGKTSTKELLATVLVDQGETHWTSGNLNNHWGVPLTLARLPATADFSVIEMGMNHIGEIEPLSKQVAPDIAIITNVSAAHIGNFNSISEIASAKAEIFRGMAPDGVAIINIDDEHYPQLLAEARTQGISNIESFGCDDKSDAQLVSYTALKDGSRATASIKGETVDYRLYLSGKHQCINALTVFLTVKALGLDLQKAATSLSNLKPVERRGNTVEVHLFDNEPPLTVIDDSYNASPASVRAGIDVLKSMRTEGKGRKIVALGDMLELGELGPQLHASLAQDLTTGVDKVFTCGSLMKNLAKALPKGTNQHYDDSQKLADDIVTQLRPDDIVLIKGSKSSLMGKVVEKICQLEKKKTKQLAEV